MADRPLESWLRGLSIFPALPLLLAPLIGHGDIASSKLRAALIWAGILGFWALLFFRTELPAMGWSLSRFRFPDCAAIGLLAWAGVSYFSTTRIDETGNKLALAELLRIASCVLLYLGVRHAFPTRLLLSRIRLEMLICAVLVSVAGIISSDPAPAVHTSHPAAAAYGNKELFSAFLVGFVPLALVLIASESGRVMRAPAQLALILLLAAILLAVNRTSYLAAFAGGCLALALVHYKRPAATSAQVVSRSSARRVFWGGLVVAALVAVIFFAGARSELGRGNIILLLSSFNMGTMEGRLPLWRAAVSMVMAHPITGIGIGLYPQQIMAGASWSNKQSIGSMDVGNIASLSSMAHNEFLQTAAELGLVGLALYLAVIVGFFAVAIGSWRHSVPGIGQTILAATISAVLAQCVDGLANPGWRYPDVSPILWLFLAIGMGVACRAPAKRQHIPSFTRNKCQPRL
jgi:O-antigen ligase